MPSWLSAHGGPRIDITFSAEAPRIVLLWLQCVYCSDKSGRRQRRHRAAVWAARENPGPFICCPPLWEFVIFHVAQQHFILKFTHSEQYGIGKCFSFQCLPGGECWSRSTAASPPSHFFCILPLFFCHFFNQTVSSRRAPWRRRQPLPAW